MNDFARSFFRLSFLLKMVAIEADFLKKLGVKHKAKYELGKMIHAVDSGFKNVKHDLKLSGNVFETELNQSDEKIQAMHNILTILADLQEKDVLIIEESLIKNIG